jgi:hypothetical protein
MLIAIDRINFLQNRAQWKIKFSEAIHYSHVFLFLARHSPIRFAKNRKPLTSETDQRRDNKFFLQPLGLEKYG